MSTAVSACAVSPRISFLCTFVYISDITVMVVAVYQHQLHRSIMSGGLDLLIRGPEVFWLWAPAHWDSIRLTFELTILPRAVAQRQQERELVSSHHQSSVQLSFCARYSFFIFIRDGSMYLLLAG